MNLGLSGSTLSLEREAAGPGAAVIGSASSIVPNRAIWVRFHPVKGPAWLYGLEAASDRRLIREQRPRLSKRAEQEDLWHAHDAVGFW